MPSKEEALHISLPREDVKWNMKRAALERRTTVRELAEGILVDWLTENGYESPERADGSTPNQP
ncbi:MAG: hypothetical protein R3C29_03985 [Dehalococcoidia bacterium]